MRFHVAFVRLAAGIGCAALIAGCGSGNGSNAPASGPTNTVGGMTQQAGSTTSAAITVPPTNGTTQTVVVGGAPVQVVIPSGSPTNVPAGTPLAVVASGSSIVHGSYPPGTTLSVNGVILSGLTVDAAGNIVQNVGLPVNSTTGTVYSFRIPQGRLSGRALTVNGGITISGAFYFRNGSIVSPIPTTLSGTIPNDGENAVGSTVTTTFGAGNDGRTAELTIDYGNGFVLDQARIIQNSAVVFNNLTTDSSNVPSNGVLNITLKILP